MSDINLTIDALVEEYGYIENDYLSDCINEVFEWSQEIQQELQKVKQESLRKPKDHEITDFVNGLVAVSHQYEGTQQLRTHVSKEVQAFLNKIGE